MDIEEIIKTLSDSIRESAGEYKETVEIPSMVAVYLCFLLPRIEEIVEFVNKRK